MKQQFCQSQLGQTLPVLWEAYTEAYQDQRLTFGYTPNYLRVACVTAPDECLANHISYACLSKVTENYILTERLSLSQQ